MRIKNRDQLEALGRSNSESLDQGEFWFSRVLGRYWVAIGKEDNGLTPHILDGFWEPWIMLWVNNNVCSGWHVADLGANVGFYTFQLAELGCSVDAFEPNPSIYDLLQKAQAKNVEEHDYNINTYNLAVSNKEDTLDFLVPRHHPMNGSLHSSVYSPDGEDVIQVRTTDTLHAYDFIKIDIEGGEIDVFDILDPRIHPLVLIEFRWDRYDDPLKFGESIFNKYSMVSFVKHDGSEEVINRASMLEAREHEDWMLVLRA